MTLHQRADALHALHVPGDPVVLPTVWDPWSARVAVGCGFAALTVGSYPVADALGRTDGEDLSLDEMLARVALIASSVQVPISADLESGYGAGPERIVSGLLEAGAVGLNVEDTVHSEGGRLRGDAEHARFVAGLRAAADRAGVHVVVNARTDLLLAPGGPSPDRLDLAVARLRAAADAGADVLYPVGLLDAGSLGHLVAELPLPVNALARPTRESRAELAALGVGRISFGPYLQRALADAARDLLTDWRTPAETDD